MFMVHFGRNGWLPFAGPPDPAFLYYQKTRLTMENGSSRGFAVVIVEHSAEFVAGADGRPRGLVLGKLHFLATRTRNQRRVLSYSVKDFVKVIHRVFEGGFGVFRSEERREGNKCSSR